jgi:hypothetical protein
MKLRAVREDTQVYKYDIDIDESCKVLSVLILYKSKYTFSKAAI